MHKNHAQCAFTLTIVRSPWQFTVKVKSTPLREGKSVYSYKPSMSTVTLGVSIVSCLKFVRLNARFATVNAQKWCSYDLPESVCKTKRTSLCSIFPKVHLLLQFTHATASAQKVERETPAVLIGGMDRYRTAKSFFVFFENSVCIFFKHQYIKRHRQRCCPMV